MRLNDRRLRKVSCFTDRRVKLQEWSCCRVLWYGSRYLCLVAGWTYCVWVCLVFTIFTLCADISLHWCHWCSVNGTSDILGGFNHLLYNLHVLSRDDPRQFVMFQVSNHLLLLCKCRVETKDLYSFSEVFIPINLKVLHLSSTDEDRVVHL